MPYDIREQDGRFCVVDESGAPIEGGCHESREQAQEHLQALYANVTDATRAAAVKFLSQFSDDVAIIRRSTDTAVKYIGDPENGRVGGYLVVWGGAEQRDLTGEYFTPDTDLGLDWYDKRPCLYHHGLDGALKASVIGVIDTLKADDTGLWAEAQLDLRQRYVRKVRELVDKGILAWSSGSLPHLVEKGYDGRIKRWPIVEGSLTPTPAEPRQTDVRTIKSALLETLPKEANASKEDTQQQSSVSNPSTNNAIKTDGVSLKMDPQEMLAVALDALLEASGAQLDEQQRADILSRALALLQERIGQEQQAEEATAAAPPSDAGAPQTVTLEIVARKAVEDPAFIAELAKMVREVNKGRQQQADAIKANVLKTARNLSGQSRAQNFTGIFNGGGQPNNPRIQVYSKYHDLDAKDMSFYAMFQNAKHQRLNLGPWLPEDTFLKEMGDKASKAIASKVLADDRTIGAAIKMWQAGSFARGLKDQYALKADELDYSTQTGFGDEWVPTLWSSDLWRRARLDNVVLPLFRAIEMPSNPFELPIEGADPTVYFVPETTSENQLTVDASANPIPDSKIASSKVTITAKKLALRVGFSLELEEDSIIPVLSIYREQAERAMLDSIDFTLLNGDDTNAPTGNINSDDADPADTERYLAFNGLRHSALVEDTTRRIDAGNVAPTLQLIRRARFAMPAAIAQRMNDIAYLVGGEVYHKLLNIDEFLTVDKYGPQATVMTGEIGKVDSSPVLTSAEFGLTEADGKASATPSNNTRGQMLVVYRPHWYVGYRRRVTTSLTFIPYYEAYQLVSTVRLGFVHLNDDSCGALYNLAV